jgi:hypothetical protein
LEEESDAEQHRSGEPDAAAHKVAIQLKILIPVGTPTSMVDSVKNAFDTDVMPTVNIWCAQTPKLTNIIAMDAATIAG